MFGNFVFGMMMMTTSIGVIFAFPQNYSPGQLRCPSCNFSLGDSTPKNNCPYNQVWDSFRKICTRAYSQPSYNPSVQDFSFEYDYVNEYEYEERK